MTGMKLAEQYYREYGREIFSREFPESFDRMAFGLVGEGSECFGFDDDISKDHDYGTDFCVFVPEEIFKSHGSRMQQVYDEMPDYPGGDGKCESARAFNRRGVISTERFYSRFIGSAGVPSDNLQWLKIPQAYLATAVNGKVFEDRYGEFSDIRQRLKSYYPEDVKKKKLAAQTFFMAQAGQYNCIRLMKRGDLCGAFLAKSEFIKAALSTVFLLNDEYMPFYKWSFQKADSLEKMKDTVGLIREFAQLELCPQNENKAYSLVETICEQTGHELNLRGYSLTGNSFLTAHSEEIMRTIRDSRIRNLDVTLDF